MKKRKHLEFSLTLFMFSCYVMVRKISHFIYFLACKHTVVFDVSLLIVPKMMTSFSVNLIEASDMKRFC